MFLDRLYDDGTVELEHEGHHFRTALATWMLGKQADGSDDPTIVRTPPLSCLDGDGYQCRATFPLLGEGQAQQLVVRTAVAIGRAPSLTASVRAALATIRTAGGRVRFDADNP